VHYTFVGSDVTSSDDGNDNDDYDSDDDIYDNEDDDNDDDDGDDDSSLGDIDFKEAARYAKMIKSQFEMDDFLRVCILLYNNIQCMCYCICRIVNNIQTYWTFFLKFPLQVDNCKMTRTQKPPSHCR